jgi:electron transport complex protein RnfE
MMKSDTARIFRDGLWDNNAGLVQLLGLCPLLAVSNTATNALGLGLATMLVLVLTNLCVSLSRGLLRREIRIPAYVLIIASVVTVTELAMQAWFYDLYKVLGIFIPLIVTNCVIIGRAEVFASRNPVVPSVLDGLATGLGFGAVLLVLGASRELLGNGSLFNRIDMLLGQSFQGFQLQVIPDHPGFLLAILPPGAFIALGMLVALKNYLDERRVIRASVPLAAAADAAAVDNP